MVDGTGGELDPVIEGAKSGGKLEGRVVAADEEALATQQFVSPIDVLIGVRWLTPVAVDQWRQGRVDCLEHVAQVNPEKLAAAMAIFLRWAHDRGLHRSDTAYVARTRDRRPLRFSDSGDEAIEAAYRAHWVSPALPEPKRERISPRQSAAPDLVVINALRDWACTECTRTGGDLLIMEGRGPLCLECADLAHLVFLPSGDAALTRRAKKGSGLSAVVVRFSRSRGRYERQGILVEEDALAQAEQQCLADDESRRRRREREEARRGAQDVGFQGSFADRILELFPGCPPERAAAIATHAGARSSGRVGRSAAGRALDAEAVTLAVVASARHEDTEYDTLLMSGVPRAEARARVGPQSQKVLDLWRRPTGAQPQHQGGPADSQQLPRFLSTTPQTGGPVF